MSTTARTSDLSVTAAPNSHEVAFTRTFDAPRDAVYALYTDADAIPQWWGPRRFRTVVDELDLRVGGRWRFLNIDSDDNEYGFHGVFHEITPGERIVQTFEFEGAPGHVSLETLSFGDDADGRTRLTGTSVCQSVEARDAMISSGMEGGMAETFDRLEALLAGS